LVSKYFVIRAVLVCIEQNIFYWQPILRRTLFTTQDSQQFRLKQSALFNITVISCTAVSVLFCIVHYTYNHRIVMYIVQFLIDKRCGDELLWMIMVTLVRVSGVAAVLFA
jgi:hypothetical protein